MQIALRVTSGPLNGQVYRFDEPQGFTFGRAEDCSCRVEEDMTFSRHHFLLEVNPPQVWLRDLGSLNGTYVNEQKVGSRLAGFAAEVAVVLDRALALETEKRYQDGGLEFLQALEQAL
jgi:eukaryotic-like serine/threonine-protein kinase